jgi:hypothetical protein
VAIKIPEALKKKIGPVPVWLILLLGAAAIYWWMKRRQEDEGALEGEDVLEDFEHLPVRAVSGAGAFDPDILDDTLETDIFSEDSGGAITGGGPPRRPGSGLRLDIRKRLRELEARRQRLREKRQQVKGKQRVQTRRQILRTSAQIAVLKQITGTAKKKKKKKK